MYSRALLVGGYDEPVKGAVIADEAKNIAALSCNSSLLIVRDHFEEIEGINNIGIDVVVEYLAGGCFCCSMKHDFELILEEGGRKRSTCDFIIEVPLIADLDVVKESIRNVLGESIKVTGMFAIDPSIAGVMMETFPELMKRSLRSSDVLAIRRGSEIEIRKLASLGSEWLRFMGSANDELRNNSSRGYFLFPKTSFE
jgi:G3E family GTPase